MKKLLGILVLGLLWCNVGIAEDLKIVCKMVKHMNVSVDRETAYDYMLEIEDDKVVTTSFIQDRVASPKNLKNLKQVRNKVTKDDINFSAINQENGNLVEFELTRLTGFMRVDYYENDKWLYLDSFSCKKQTKNKI